MGSSFIDYIIADKVIIDEKTRKNFTEKVLYMPNSYQPNDDQREIAASGLTRVDIGVSEDTFLFCCLNSSYKITRKEFNIWMRVLSKFEKSELMLLSSNKWSDDNLKIEAEKRGVDPQRLIFVPHVSHDKHLERMALADLFLDTFNVNAHTTASDALWAGVPVITKIGKQFAARVAASLLYATSLNELVVETESEYENLILELATDKQKLNSIKERLRTDIKYQPLYDTKFYTHSFEKALLEAHYVFANGKTRRDIII